MRVRVWIRGAEGPSHDFELLDAPRIGERISISLTDHTEEGFVRGVTWQLQGIERAQDGLALDVEPAGSVAIVHVVCGPAPGEAMLHEAAAEAEFTR